MTRHSLVALATLALVAQPLTAQPRASERGTMSQLVNGTRLTVDYSRPVARGRDNLLGGVVHFGEIWTPGANWATTLEVDKPIKLDGHDVAPGKYSVWIELKDGAPWRFMLNEEWRLYHDSPFPAEKVVAAFDVEPREGAHMEALNWYVHTIGPRAATLRMHWGPTYVEVSVETEEFTWEPVPHEERTQYLGAFAFDTRDPTTGGPMRVTITVLEENGRITGRWGNAPIALVPVDRGEFRIGFLRGGALFDVGDEMTLRVSARDGVSYEAELLWEGEPFGVGRKVR